MDIKTGSVVRALAGREKGRYFVAVDVHDGFVYLSDGKERKLGKPKKKNIKHISPVHRFIETEQLTDRKLRQQLQRFSDEDKSSSDQ